MKITCPYCLEVFNYTNNNKLRISDTCCSDGRYYKLDFVIYNRKIEILAIIFSINNQKYYLNFHNDFTELYKYHRNKNLFHELLIKMNIGFIDTLQLDNLLVSCQNITNKMLKLKILE